MVVLDQLHLQFGLITSMTNFQPRNIHLVFGVGQLNTDSDA